MIITRRPHSRSFDSLRNISIQRNFIKYAEGSVLICLGDTHVLCTASIINRVPLHQKNTGCGWVTAEYSMIPRATHSRSDREAIKGKQNARTQEIQRLIGRSLRNILDLKILGEHTIYIDCDVLQADGGTRTASITGAYVAIKDAVNYLLKIKYLKQNPIIDQIAAISVGIDKNHIALLDLDYIEDRECSTDMNIVMTKSGGIVEIQGTAEGKPFFKHELDQLLILAEKGIRELFVKQDQSSLFKQKK